MDGREFPGETDPRPDTGPRDPVIDVPTDDPIAVPTDPPVTVPSDVPFDPPGDLPPPDDDEAPVEWPPAEPSV